MHNTKEGLDEDAKVAITIVAEIMVVKTTMKIKKKMNHQNWCDKTAVVEEVIILIIQMLNVTFVKNIDITQRIATPIRKWKKMKI